MVGKLQKEKIMQTTLSMAFCHTKSKAKQMAPWFRMVKV